MAFSDNFTGTTLDPKWTFFAGSPATCTQTVADGVLAISLPAGTAFDNFTNGTNSQNAPSIKQTIGDVDFDIAVLYSDVPLDSNRGHGFIVNGGGTDAIRADIFHNTGNIISLFCLSRVSSSATTHFNAQLPNGTYNQGQGGFPAWQRLKREGSTWTIYTSSDGTTWTQQLQFTRTLTVSTVGVIALKASAAGGYTAKIRKIISLSEQADPKDSLQATLASQQWSTDFSSGALPSWLTDVSVNSGSATVTTGNLQLGSRSDITGSGGRVIFNAATLANSDLLVRFRMQTKPDAENCYFIPGVSSTGVSIDGYSPGESYIGELNNGNNVVRGLRVVHPVRSHSEAPYSFLMVGTVTGWAVNTWLWARVRRVNLRVQIRFWADGSPEPSAWAYDGEDNAVSWASGVPTGVPFLSWSHNPGAISTPATHTADVSQLTITSLGNAVSGYWGIKNRLV